MRSVFIKAAAICQATGETRIIDCAAAAGAAIILLVNIALPGDHTRVEARDQWQMNHGTTPLNFGQSLLPGGAHSGYVPAVGQNFWKDQIANKLPAGSILTAILENDLSSAKNQRGDTFALTLEDGFHNGHKLLIPPGSRIIGTVMNATSAKQQRNGQAGTMEVSLQSLVFPDGSHYPIAAVIEGNPGARFAKPAKARHLGVNMADYGQSLAAMATSFVTGPGFMMKRLNKGNEFQLSRGEALPVRLTRGLNFAGQNQFSGSPNMAGIGNPNGPIQIPGFTSGPVGQSMSSGAPPVAPPRAVTAADPNAIFNQPDLPAGSSLNQADPF